MPVDLTGLENLRSYGRRSVEEAYAGEGAYPKDLLEQEYTRELRDKVFPRYSAAGYTPSSGDVQAAVAKTLQDTDQTLRDAYARRRQAALTTAQGLETAPLEYGLRETALMGQTPEGTPTEARLGREQTATLTREGYANQRDLLAMRIQSDAALQGQRLDWQGAQNEADRRLRAGLAVGTVNGQPTLEATQGTRRLDIAQQEADARLQALKNEQNWRQTMLYGNLGGAIAQRTGLLDWLFGPQGGRGGPGGGPGGGQSSPGVLGTLAKTAYGKAKDYLFGAKPTGLAPYGALSPEAQTVADQLVAQGFPKDIALQAANDTVQEGLSPTGESISNYLANYYGDVGPPVSPEAPWTDWATEGDLWNFPDTSAPAAGAEASNVAAPVAENLSTITPATQAIYDALVASGYPPAEAALSAYGAGAVGAGAGTEGGAMVGASMAANAAPVLGFAGAIASSLMDYYGGENSDRLLQTQAEVSYNNRAMPYGYDPMRAAKAGDAQALATILPAYWQGVDLKSDPLPGSTLREIHGDTGYSRTLGIMKAPLLKAYGYPDVGYGTDQYFDTMKVLGGDIQKRGQVPASPEIAAQWVKEAGFDPFTGRSVIGDNDYLWHALQGGGDLPLGGSADAEAQRQSLRNLAAIRNLLPLVDAQGMPVTPRPLPAQPSAPGMGNWSFDYTTGQWVWTPWEPNPDTSR